jgi:hypothetical protein
MVGHLVTITQGQVAYILHSVLSGAMYENIVEELKGQCGDWKLTVDYHSQPKVRTQLTGK